MSFHHEKSGGMAIFLERFTQIVTWHLEKIEAKW